VTPARSDIGVRHCVGRPFDSRGISKERARAGERDVRDQTLGVHRPPRVALNSRERAPGIRVHCTPCSGTDRPTDRRSPDARACGQLPARRRPFIRLAERAQRAIELPARGSGRGTNERSDRQCLCRPALRDRASRQHTRAEGAALTDRVQSAAERQRVRLGDSSLPKSRRTSLAGELPLRAETRPGERTNEKEDEPSSTHPTN
jgi:hypothetical protein